jgi:RNA polymerase sigma-70 factor (ECF subfamily)
MKDESVLLSGAKKLDQVALTSIFDMYAPVIYRYALRLCHDPIESDNIVGDVFAQLLEKFAAGEGPQTNLRSYLYQIAYHVVIDGARHNRRFAPHAGVSNAPGKAITISIEIEERVLIEALVATLNNELSELQRHVIILRFFEGCSLRETAVIIGKTVNYAKVIQNRAIARLRNSLVLQFAIESQHLSS